MITDDNFEPIYEAFFQLVSGASFSTPGGDTEFKTKQRRKKKVDPLNSSNMPAIFQVQVSETPLGTKQVHGMPIKWHLKIELIVYVHSSEITDINGSKTLIFPSKNLNPVIGGIREAISPSPATRQTLGGLVEWVYIDNSGVRMLEHPDGNQAMATIPVNIFVYGQGC